MATPSILLIPDRYKSGVLYSQLPESGAVDLDFTRGSTATRVNASGLIESVASGVPRLDYPAAGGCPSLLLEPQRTNLVLRSEEFDNASWVKSGSPIVNSNVAIAPDGEMTADRITVDDSLSERCEQSFVISPNTQYIFSVYLKAGTQNTGQPFLNTTAEGAVNTLVAISNEWVRYSLIIPNTNTLTNIIIRIYPSSFVPVGAFGDNILVWGAQLETGSVATSYIPTTTASVTRLADAASKTGISSLIGQTEGTLFIDYNVNILGSVVEFSLNAGSNANAVRIRQTTGNVIQTLINDAGSAQASIQTPFIVDIGNRYKAAIAYKENDFAFYVNGVQIGTDTNGTVPSCSAISTDNGTGSSLFSGQINQALVFTTRLTNAELASLTSL